MAVTSKGRVRFSAIGVGLLGSAVAVLLCIVYVAANDWFGSGDIRSYALWSAPFSVLLASVALLTRDWLQQLSRTRRYALAALLGLASGVVWTFAVALSMGPWVGTFSFPILYLWMLGGLSAMLIWAAYVGRTKPSAEELISARDGGTKRLTLLVLGVPIGAVAVAYAIVFGASYGSIHIWDRAEPELHLIPQGVEGPVLIVFNDPDGEPAEYEGESRVYEIPKSGVLRTQFSPNEGWRNPVYMYVDEQGQRTSIVTGAPCEDSLPGDSVQACLMSRAFMLDGQPIPDYQGYVVGREAERRDMYSRGDSLVRAEFLGTP